MPNGFFLWSDDVDGATTDLSAAEFGIHVRLMMSASRNNGLLPSDPTRLARTCRVSMPEWRRAAPAVMRLWRSEPDGWRNAYIEQQLEKQRQKSAQARSAVMSRSDRKPMELHGSTYSDVPTDVPTPQPPPLSPSPYSNEILPAHPTAGDLSRVSDAAGLVVKPAKRGAEGQVLAGWLAMGFEIDADIIPAIKRALRERPGPTRSLARFEDVMLDLAARRDGSGTIRPGDDDDYRNPLARAAAQALRDGV
jgi:uncharacterized protein YdaU (DUF1376 family)